MALQRHFKLDDPIGQKTAVDSQGVGGGTAREFIVRNGDGMDFDGINQGITFPYSNIGKNISYSVMAQKQTSSGRRPILFYMQTELYFTDTQIVYRGDTSKSTYLTYDWEADELWNNIIVTQEGTVAKMYFNELLVATDVNHPPVNNAFIPSGFIGFTVGPSYYSGGLYDLKIYGNAITPGNGTKAPPKKTGAGSDGGPSDRRRIEQLPPLGQKETTSKYNKAVNTKQHDEVFEKAYNNVYGRRNER